VPLSYVSDKPSSWFIVTVTIAPFEATAARSLIVANPEVMKPSELTFHTTQRRWWTLSALRRYPR
jgi:hypothetical protein